MDNGFQNMVRRIISILFFTKEIDLDQLLASCLFPFALGHTVMKDAGFVGY